MRIRIAKEHLEYLRNTYPDNSDDVIEDLIRRAGAINKENERDTDVSDQETIVFYRFRGDYEYEVHVEVHVCLPETDIIDIGNTGDT